MLHLQSKTSELRLLKNYPEMIKKNKRLSWGLECLVLTTKMSEIFYTDATRDFANRKDRKHRLELRVLRNSFTIQINFIIVFIAWD